MPLSYYPTRQGEYVYDVIVAKDESLPLSRRYRALLRNAERVEDGRIAPVVVDVPDGYGPTVSEAIRALEDGFDVWRLNDARGGSWTGHLTKPAPVCFCNKGWICERHPEQGWPHVGCAGPGTPCARCGGDDSARLPR